MIIDRDPGDENDAPSDFDDDVDDCWAEGDCWHNCLCDLCRDEDNA